MRPPLIPQTIPIHDQEPSHIRILKTLYNTLVEYREPKTNRIVISIFMCLPSRKDFPEYFDIIQRPISMYEIRKRIESSYYRSEDPCLDDFRLMFNNCRTFNEDGSVIYNDANNLEDMLMKRYSQLVPESERTDNSTTSRGNNNHSTAKSNAPTPSMSPFATTTSKLTTNIVSSPTRREEKFNNNHQQHAPSPIATPGKRYSKKSSANSNTIHNNFNNNHQSQQRNSTPSHGQPNQFSHSNNFNSNGLTSDADSNSNSNQFSSCNGNTNDSFIINHNFHNDASIDSNSNLSIGPNASTAPKTNEKPTKRQKRDPDAPKRRLLTGYIIYAAEVRKEYVDKHPNQDFGFISRLIGNDWKALPRDLRVKYEQRALVHNKKMREKAIMDSMMTTPDGQQQFSYHQNQQYPQQQQQPQAPSMTNGTSTPKLTKRKLAKLAKEQERLHNSSTPYLNQDNSFATPMRQHDRSSHMASQAANSSYRSSEYNYQRSYPYSAQQGTLGEQDTGTTMKVESSTQTAPFRFVEPPAPRRHAYAENFRRYIAGLDVPNMDLLEEETACLDKPPEPVSTWLGAGTGRHESTEAALWALRDFMLQDSDTMRLNMQPYLCY